MLSCSSGQSREQVSKQLQISQEYLQIPMLLAALVADAVKINFNSKTLLFNSPFNFMQIVEYRVNIFQPGNVFIKFQHLYNIICLLAYFINSK